MHVSSRAEFPAHNMLVLSFPPTGLLLNHNYLTDMSARLLSELVRSTTSLRLLDLRGNHIGPEGKKMLTRALHENKTVTQVKERTIYQKRKPSLTLVSPRCCQIVCPKGERQVLEGVRRQLPAEEGSNQSDDYSQDEDEEQDKNHFEYVWAIQTSRSLVVDLRDNQPDRRGDRFLEQLMDVSLAVKSFSSAAANENTQAAGTVVKVRKRLCQSL